MNSINKNQPEQNHEDLSGAPAIAKIRELVDQAKTVFFCTQIREARPFDARPMAVQEVNDQGQLVFFAASDSDMIADIGKDPAVQLLAQGSAHSDMLMLYGRATVSSDKATIERLWSPILKTWFTEGKDDPRIRVITISPEQGYYWDTKHNRAVQLAKMIAGAITGKTLDDSIEGNLRVH